MNHAKPYLMVVGATLLLLIAGCAKQKTAGTTVTTLPSTAGTPVIVSSGAPSAGVTTAGVHHVISGEVTDVDRNSGKVNIRASDGSKVQVILPPLAVATANKGDRASIDVKLAPAR